jgi:hypothetical protein
MTQDRQQAKAGQLAAKTWVGRSTRPRAGSLLPTARLVLLAIAIITVGRREIAVALDRPGIGRFPGGDRALEDQVG